MKKLIVSLFETVVFSLVLSSCSDLGTTIRHDLTSVVSKNASAVSHIEWESSDSQPKMMFAKYRQQQQDFLDQSDVYQAEKLASEICKGLNALSDESLALFEIELRSEQNAVLISFCKLDLLTRIDDFHKSGRKGLQYSVDALSNKPSNIDFKLKMEIDESSDLNTFNKYWANLKENEVILTFDDGPDPMYTDSILRTLKEAGDLKALFFTLGKNVQLYPEKVMKEHQEGHLVANHSWNHYCLDQSEVCRNYNNKNFNNLPALTDEDVLAEIEKTYEEIKKAVGVIAPYFRFPFGNARPSMAKYLKERGAYVMSWSIDSNDWRQMQSIAGQEIPYTNQDMVRNVITAIEVKKRGVILFHDVHRRTAESLPQVLFELYKRNYKVILLKSKNLEAIKLDRDVVRPTPQDPPPFYDFDN